VSNIAVVYKSKYGTTKRYAQWVAAELDAQLFEAKQITPARLAAYDLVIYGGGLYAGGIIGVSLVRGSRCKALAVFTVGLADPAITDYTKILDTNLPDRSRDQVKLFHLRGGINYAALSLVHKGMMALVRKAAAKKPEADRDSDDIAMLATYGRAVDFTDKAAIAPIIAYAKEVTQWT